MSRLVVALALIAAGCYDPHPPAGAPCERDDQCPESLRCVANTCGGSLPADADMSCTCSGSTLMCSSGETECALGCNTEGFAHCTQIVPSNGLDLAWANTVTQTVTFPDGTITLDTDTGEISGTFTRPPGTGVVLAGILFMEHVSQGEPIGVFVMHELRTSDATQIVVTGTAAVAFLVGTTAEIAGEILGNGGCGGMQTQCGGPGGRVGTKQGDPVPACGGSHGVSGGQSTDGGGGGGGNGSVGGNGGNAGNTLGGVGGGKCGTDTLEPLIGGAGGGGGGPGGTTPPFGGGGGGAIQITVLGPLSLSALIAMNGVGGEGGLQATNSAAGSGGGAGGSILIEAPAITFAMATLAANGGGGGGGGSGTANVSGAPGANGGNASTPASGGLSGGGSAGNGGPGAAGVTVAGAGVTGGSTSNGGGGGGGVGRIRIRATSPDTMGVSSSPPAQTATITTN